MPLDRSWPALGAETAAVATAIAVVASVPLAWLVENRQFAGKRALSAIITAAIALPAPLLCYLLIAHARPVGLPAATIAGLLSAMPLFLRQTRAFFAAIPPTYAKAARSLGVPEWRVFARVELPLVWRPIAAVAAWGLVRLILEFAVAWRIAASLP